MQGELRGECVLTRADVARAAQLWISTSVREWIEALLVR